MIDLTGLIAISGYPGLYKVVAQAKNGVIVESLLDAKRMIAHSNFKISALEDISIYTNGEDMPLKEIYFKIFEKENGGPSVSAKADAKEMQKYLESVLPDYDKERVHQSDIKKLFSWYNLIQEKGLLKVKENDENAEDGKEGNVIKPELKKDTKQAIKPSAKETNTKVKSNTSGQAKKTATVRKTGA